MASKGSIGARIQAAREQRGITRSELARLAKVTPTAVWNWEENDTQPRADAVSNLARVLGVSEGYLKDGGTLAATEIQGGVAATMDRLRNLIADATGIPANNIEIDVKFKL